jgi:putative ABC transport system permease protein
VSDKRRPVLGALLGAVVLVLLVSCANASALVLGRLTARQREIAVKQALGARRATIVLDFLRESLALSIAAGIAGVTIAAGALRVIQAALAAELPPGVVLRVDTQALLLAVCVVLLCAVLVGLAPALHATRGAGTPVIAFVRGMSDTRATRRFRNGLVICEVALSVLLLVGAALVLASLGRLHRASPGFDPSGVAAAYATLPAQRYPTPAQQGAFFLDVVDRLIAMPQIAGAAVVFGLPFDDNYAAPYAIGGRPLPPTAERPRAGLRIVSEDYFRVMRIHLVAGRLFTAADRPGAANVCIVNQTLARRQFGAGPAVGQILLRGRNADPYEIIGVVADVKTNGLTGPTPEEVFYAFRQSPRPNATLVARTPGNPDLLAPLMQSAVSAVDRSQPLFGFASMARRLEITLGPERILAGLTLAFSLMAMLLASVGLYAVLAHSVMLRTPEIGIRMAIGADRRAIVRLVVAQGLRLVAVGIAAGLIAAAFASQVLAAQLFEVNPRDPLLYGGVAILFAMIGTAASLAPALRASRIEPAISLGGS